jgi:hypothetical protein
VRWIFERDPRNGREPPHLGFDLDNDLLGALGFEVGRSPDSLRYAVVPFEFIPFGWQGGDGLQYGHLVHAPELDPIDFPVGSFSPADDTGVWWLGDDTFAGIQNLISANLRIAEEDPDWGGSADDYLGDGELVAFCARFGFRLTPATDRSVTRGGRSERRIVPPVPPGWAFRASPRNGVGVLAPETSFADLPAVLAYDHGDLAPFLERARTYLQDGHPGSALCQLYEVHSAASFDRHGREAFVLMQQTYERLGRPQLAERVAWHLAHAPHLQRQSR